jgi:hypothetical protein
VTVKIFVVLLAISASVLAQDARSSVFNSNYARADVGLSTDPTIEFWRASSSVQMAAATDGRPQAEYRTRVYSRWTDKYIYFLFVCPYKQLYLKPKPDVSSETNELWNWNVAEVFLGSNFADIKRYREFEISPQNEWIDLDIDLHNPHHEQGWIWNSGFEHEARIDRDKHVWYAALRIPFGALDIPHPKVGTKFRANLYRTEGPPDHAKQIVWQPTMSTTFHVPEKFGLLTLVGSN